MSSNRPRVVEGLYYIYQEHPGKGRVEVTHPPAPSLETPNSILTSTKDDGKEWRIRRQPGIETLCSIEAGSKLVRDATSLQFWGLHATDTPAQLNYSSYTSVWSIECEKSPAANNGMRTYSNCKIIEAGTNKYWFTDDKGEIQLTGATDQPSELRSYELVEVPFKTLGRNRPTMTVSSYMFLSVTASDAATIKKLYFGINKLSKKDCNRYTSLRLETDARYVGSPGKQQAGSVWFELAILTNLPAEGEVVTNKHIKFSSGEPVIRESHRLLPRENASYQRLFGQAYNEDNLIIDFLEEGDSIGVLVCAQGNDSGCEVRSGKLTLYEKRI
ncbi:hypothetical protein RSAG8_12736, partial [Rhizoctonia solani AG-8 WAC10335]